MTPSERLGNQIAQQEGVIMNQSKDTLIEELLQVVENEGPDSLRGLLERVCQRVLEAEMSDFLQAEPYERTDQRQGYRNGYKTRSLTTR